MRDINETVEKYLNEKKIENKCEGSGKFLGSRKRSVVVCEKCGNRYRLDKASRIPDHSADPQPPRFR